MPRYLKFDMHLREVLLRKSGGREEKKKISRYDHIIYFDLLQLTERE